MPAMPYQALRTPTIATKMQMHTAVTKPHKTPNNGQPQNIIILMEEAIVQTIKNAKVLITRVVFSKNAMVYSRNKKKEIVDKAITESVPQFYMSDDEFMYHLDYTLFWLIFTAVFQSFITNTVMHGMEFIP
ncbi:hypothetical protein DFJ58DRAFT_720606 [Suillus subalutaceus]|uniref:uncharacterized protein n=1 Tax=Suillus subalutaceus TaxID=48586 RepID=UPI001B87D167|nr:uncharacterized protein DFJ58DRAFT_720606 [Suillus subalutaceus]KAG1877841.1 hypothetical protein DFJ58DRAFT_720606 [Suillus subalutaceus]